MTAAVVQMLGGRTMKGRTAQLAWAGNALTHQSAGRIVVETDECRMERT